MKTQAFPAIFAEIKKDVQTRRAETFREMDEKQTADEILKHAYYRQYIPKGKAGKVWGSVDELREYIKARMIKADEKSLQSKADRLNQIAAAPAVVKDIVITVEWKNNRTWGATPTATAEVRTETPDNSGSSYNNYKSASIGGCGYDKQSTAVAQALNQSPALLHMLCNFKEGSPAVKNHDLFGYGSGYGITPSFEGGVGVSCYPDIFRKIGMKWERISGGKMFEVYKVSKI